MHGFGTYADALPALWGRWWGLEWDGYMTSAILYVSCLAFTDDANPGGVRSSGMLSRANWDQRPWLHTNLMFLATQLTTARATSLCRAVSVRCGIGKLREIADVALRTIESEPWRFESRVADVIASTRGGHETRHSIMDCLAFENRNAVGRARVKDGGQRISYNCKAWAKEAAAACGLCGG